MELLFGMELSVQDWSFLLKLSRFLHSWVLIMKGHSLGKIQFYWRSDIKIPVKKNIHSLHSATKIGIAPRQPINIYTLKKFFLDVPYWYNFKRYKALVPERALLSQASNKRPSKTISWNGNYILKPLFYSAIFLN